MKTMTKREIREAEFEEFAKRILALDVLKRQMWIIQWHEKYEKEESKKMMATLLLLWLILMEEDTTTAQIFYKKSNNTGYHPFTRTALQLCASVDKFGEKEALAATALHDMDGNPCRAKEWIDKESKRRNDFLDLSIKTRVLYQDKDGNWGGYWYPKLNQNEEFQAGDEIDKERFEQDENYRESVERQNALSTQKMK